MKNAVRGWLRAQKKLCATKSEARGCSLLGALYQWWLIHGEERLIRDERAFGGDFQQASMESGKGVAVEGGSIRDGKLAAMMMMRGAVMIVTILG